MTIPRAEIEKPVNAMLHTMLDYLDPDTKGNKWLLHAGSVAAKYQESLIYHDDAVAALDAFLSQMTSEIARDESLVSVGEARRIVAAIRELIVISH